MESRLEFVLSLEREDFTMTELCGSCGVSRKTGYRWLARHKAGGVAALFEQSRAPKSCPHRTDPAVVQLNPQAAGRASDLGRKEAEGAATAATPRAWRASPEHDSRYPGATGPCVNALEAVTMSFMHDS